MTIPLYNSNLYQAIRQLLLLLSILCLFAAAGCRDRHSFEDTMLTDTSSFFYFNPALYPDNLSELPIGVFDSGTGGLAVLDDIVNYQCIETNEPVFGNEYFIYLADMANMPYGSYAMENNVGLLQEHIMKNVQFLTGNKYYDAAGSSRYLEDKRQVKAVVIACNTATAYGKDKIEDFLAKTVPDIILVGVIDAATTAAINSFYEDESGTIAVLATDGTVRSEAYVHSLMDKNTELGRTGDISIFQQAGVGIAEAIDDSRDFIDRTALVVRENYRGPSEQEEGDMFINPAVFNRYMFDLDNGALLFEGNIEHPFNIQINSIENYVAFHLVSLMEKIKDAGNVPPLKTIILGCTHYPYVDDVISDVLGLLRNYSEDGEYIYRQYMADEISLINPGVKVARQLYELMQKKNITGNNNPAESEFYIAVPNILNRNVQLREDGAFTYEYKYGRQPGEIQEYVKRIPFNREAIPDDILLRLNQQIPRIYELMTIFNHDNPKTVYLPEGSRISAQ